MSLSHAPTGITDLHAKIPAKEVDGHLRRCIAEMNHAERNVFVWFALMEERRLFRDLGYSSMQAYAADKLGFTLNRTNRYLHLIGALGRLPLIRRALQSGEIGWTKARVIVKAASPATEAHWLEAARSMSRRDLEARIRQARCESAARRKANPDQTTLDAPKPADSNAEGARGHASQGIEGGSHPGAPGAGSCDVVDAKADANNRSAPLLPLELQADLVDDGPVSVVLRLTPLELARFEAQIEQIYKLRLVGKRAKREEIILTALEELIDSAARGSEQAAGGGKADQTDPGADPAKTGALVPRGTNRGRYKIVIHKCERCGRAGVQSAQGERAIGRAQLEAAECDAVIAKPGERNRSTIPPSTRLKVQGRDRFRCRAPGCNNTRFLDLHHIVSRAQGGSNHPDNLVVLCSRCHNLWHELRLDGEILKSTEPEQE